MKFVYNFYIISIFFTKIIWKVASEENFDDIELTHLARKLEPIECLRLLETMYLKRPVSDEDFVGPKTKISLDDESILRRQLEMPFFNQDNCRNKLEEWSRNLPQKSSKWARVAIETELRTLGRPDLAKYMKRNRRVARHFDKISRLSRNPINHVTPAPEMIQKKTHATASNTEFKSPPKEVVIQYYQHPESAMAKSEKSRFETREDSHSGVQKSYDDDTTTRWTAFLTLLAVIILTILSTVIFALYKKNRSNLCTKNDKCGEDRCPLADRCSARKAPGSVNDVEKGGDATPNSRCGRRRERIRSSMQEQSRSPSSVSCLRDEIPSARKPKIKKSLKPIKQKRDTPSVSAETKPRKRGCAKRCTGLKERVPTIDKSTKTRDSKISEKSNQSEVSMSKPRLELKKFHEKIASILRRDDQACKCCKCAILPDDDSSKCTSTKNKNICMDEKCEKTRLRSIAELCLSHEETYSPTDEGDDLDMRRRKKKRKKQKKKKKKKEKKSKDEAEKDKETDKDKESEKSSPENSARSKDKRDSRIKKKPAKARKERYNTEEHCTRKTCEFLRTNMEDVTNFD